MLELKPATIVQPFPSTGLRTAHDAVQLEGLGGKICPNEEHAALKHELLSVAQGDFWWRRIDCCGVVDGWMLA